MALDPTRYLLTQTLNGSPAVSVSLAWVQERLNEAFGSTYPSIAVDGVFGPETRAAVTHYLFDTLGVERGTMMKNGKYYTAELIPGAEGRVAITPAFEQALSSAGMPAIGWGVVLVGVLGTVLIVRKVLKDPGLRGLGDDTFNIGRKRKPKKGVRLRLPAYGVYVDGRLVDMRTYQTRFDAKRAAEHIPGGVVDRAGMRFGAAPSLRGR